MDSSCILRESFVACISNLWAAIRTCDNESWSFSVKPSGSASNLTPVTAAGPHVSEGSLCCIGTYRMSSLGTTEEYASRQRRLRHTALQPGGVSLHPLRIYERWRHGPPIC